MGTTAAQVNGVEIAFERAGEGGTPLLLLHGWPETRRIWRRVVEPLAADGFEVIAPDLRGFGDSGLAPDDRYDVAAHSHDLAALVAGELGHERVFACGGDLGGLIAQDLSLRYEGLVDRLCLFNTIAPVLPGTPRGVEPLVRMAADYFVRQSRDADGSRPSSTAPSCGAATWRSSTARASGRLRARSSRRT